MRAASVLASLLVSLPAYAVDGPVFSGPFGPYGTGVYHAAADIDEDGHLDLIGVSASNEIAILPGIGDGTFGAEILIEPLSGTVRSIGVGDFDEDGNLDIVVAVSSAFHLLTGNGDFTFASPVITWLDALGSAHGTLVDDLDQDGHLDVAIAQRTGGALIPVLLGNGDGTFRQEVFRSDGGRPLDVAAADLDGDGIRDLVVNNDFLWPAIHLGLGDGRFPLDHVIEARAFGDFGIATILDDVDGDGEIDIISSSLNGGIAWFRGRGDGTFLPQGVQPVEASPQGIASADVDGDGNQDLVSAVAAQALLGTGNGTFVAEPALPLGTFLPHISTGDFDEDGEIDLALSGDVLSPSGVRILLNEAPFPGVCTDADADGFGFAGAPSCPGGGARDCDESSSGTYPGRPELCDGIDNDCDEIVDEGFDDDADGFPNDGCGATDCNDRDGRVRPDATEVCNLVDDDCDGTIDAGPDVDASCDDGFACTVDLCGTTAACAHDSSACFAAGLAGTLFPGRAYWIAGWIESSIAGPFDIAAGELDGIAPTDVALAFDRGVVLRFGGADGGIDGERRIVTEHRPRALAVGDFIVGGGYDDVAYLHGEISVLFDDGLGGFGEVGPFPAGPSPTSIVAGTLDGDAVPDLVAVNTDTDQISVLVTQPLGGFSGPVSYPAGTRPKEIALGRLDAGDEVDLVAANTSTNELTVLLGNGDGSFGAPTAFAFPGSAPRSVAIADFDEDGLGDLAVAAIADDEIAILPGTGGGSFGAALKLTTASGPLQVIVGDFDADLHDDVAAVAHEADAVSVYFGDGAGNFGAELRLPTGRRPLGLAGVALDGIPGTDLVSAGHEWSTLGLLRELSGVAAASSYEVGVHPQALATGYLDADAVLDLVVANAGTHPNLDQVSDVSVLLGIGDGSFGAESRHAVGVGPRGVAVGDVDNDGLADIVVANRGVETGFGSGGDLSILIGNGDGTFQTEYRVAADDLIGLTLGDADLDGRLDIAVVDASFEPALLLGNGDGTFGAPLPIDAGPGPTYQAIFDELTGDVFPDLVLAQSGEVALLPGNGDGTFAGAVPVVGGSENSRAIAVGDYDRDGRRDIAAGGGGGEVFIYRNNPAGTLSKGGFGRFPPWIESVVSADFNLDGFRDLAALDEFRNLVAVYLGDGQGGLTPGATFLAGGRDPRALVTADFDADGRQDLAVANRESDTVSVLLNQGPLDCPDLDGDGFGEPAVPICPAGFQTDCDDLDPLTFPGAIEYANGADNDCDGAVDEAPLLPGLVPDVTIEIVSGDTFVNWIPAPAANYHELYRGTFSVSQRAGAPYDHAALSCFVTNSFRDNTAPASGQGLYWLVRGVNADGKGLLGLDGDGNAVPDPGGCP